MTSRFPVPSFWPTVFAIPALALLVGLGLWQLERLAWKEALIARMEVRLGADAVPFPDAERWPRTDWEAFDYRPVTLTGTFRHDQELYWFAGGDEGAGYHVLTPVALEGGGTVVANRGFVPFDRRDPGTRREGQIAGEQTLSGIARLPSGRFPFDAADEPQNRLWFVRDLESMRDVLPDELDPVAPVFVDLEAMSLPGGLPAGGRTRVALSNRHLEYALTWFGLAFCLVTVYVAYHWKRAGSGET